MLVLPCPPQPSLNWDLHRAFSLLITVLESSLQLAFVQTPKIVYPARLLTLPVSLILAYKRISC